MWAFANLGMVAIAFHNAGSSRNLRRADEPCCLPGGECLMIPPTIEMPGGEDWTFCRMIGVTPFRRLAVPRRMVQAWLQIPTLRHARQLLSRTPSDRHPSLPSPTRISSCCFFCSATSACFACSIAARPAPPVARQICAFSVLVSSRVFLKTGLHWLVLQLHSLKRTEN